MKIVHMLLLGSCSLSLFSCVSSKKFKAEQAKNAELTAQYAQSQSSLKTCEDDKAEAARKRTALESEIDGLNKQISFLKENNTQALKQLENLSVISGSQAESIKKSLENIGAKDLYIQDLQSAMAKKDSLNRESSSTMTTRCGAAFMNSRALELSAEDNAKPHASLSPARNRSHKSRPSPSPGRTG